MMFWGDIILKYPKLIPELATFGAPTFRRFVQSRRPTEAGTPNLIALNWGYEANHPFEKEAAQFAKAKIPFYVCPGTSTWQTLIGRHDNALANLRAAAKAGKKFGAIGYLITDWGDGGHPQPLAVSWPLFARRRGAGVECKRALTNKDSLPVLSRDVFEDSTGKIAAAAFKLGFAHQKLGVKAPNETPLGTVIAAPKPEERELFCRNGLKWFAKIPPGRFAPTLKEIEKQRAVLLRAKPKLGFRTKLLARGTGFGGAHGGAVVPVHVVAASASPRGKHQRQNGWREQGIRELRKLEKDFNAYWPLRNKATPQHCSAFLKWRIRDLLESKL